MPSTPATRGEVEAEVFDQQVSVEELAAMAADLGFGLVPLDPEVSDHAPKPPAGNARAEDWEAYARLCGAGDADLVDVDGEPLGRDALREKYGPKAE